MLKNILDFQTCFTKIRYTQKLFLRIAFQNSYQRGLGGSLLTQESHCKFFSIYGRIPYSSG